MARGPDGRGSLRPRPDGASKDTYRMSQTTHPSPLSGHGTLRRFLVRLHFYIGLFVGPFLFVAALTGLLYVLTPQIEARLYASVLTTTRTGPARSLADQAAAARAHLNDSLAISAVRPAPGAGLTTRVLFSDPSLGDSENRTVFVDPVTLAVTGDLTTYGTSGILPFRLLLDGLHRNLLLGDWGRYYSELAASWLWVAVAGGVFLWATGPGRRRALADMPPAQRRRWLHATIGVTVSGVLVFISVTGLTWSQAGGARIDAMRGALGWETPSVSTALDTGTPSRQSAHHDHAGMAGPAVAAAVREDRAPDLDAVAQAARVAGLESPYLEIRLPKPGQAWVAREYDRRWPTQVDTVTLHPDTLAVTSRADFADFSLIPKLVRWGIDAHMGILFGWPNQVLMAIVATGLLATIAYGYRMWWTRRPAAGAPPLAAIWRDFGIGGRTGWAAAALVVGWALPVLGISLALFLAIDWLRDVTRRRMRAAAS